MKTLFIFALYTFLFISSCASSNQNTQAESNLSITGSYQNWYASAPGEAEYTERGIDLRLELCPAGLVTNPLYIIFNERESFPVEVSKTDSGNNEEKLLIEGRIVMQTTLFDETSGHTRLSDRLVFHDENGELQYAEINNWQRLPNRYN